MKVSGTAFKRKGKRADRVRSGRSDMRIRADTSRNVYGIWYRQGIGVDVDIGNAHRAELDSYRNGLVSAARPTRRSRDARADNGLLECDNVLSDRSALGGIYPRRRDEDIHDSGTGDTLRLRSVIRLRSYILRVHAFCVIEEYTAEDTTSCAQKQKSPDTCPYRGIIIFVFADARNELPSHQSVSTELPQWRSN